MSLKILAVADEPAPKYYDYYRPGILKEFDLIVSCGDLRRGYLEFLVTMAHCPLIYVRGNHDDSFLSEPPEGCECIEDKVFVYKGVRFLGLGGSYRYRRDGRNMYTERDMASRIRRRRRQIAKAGGLDVLVTHAPALGHGDLESLAHRGFACFNDLLETYEPAYLIHGHVHRNYGPFIPAVQQFGETTIVNAWQAQVIEIG